MIDDVSVMADLDTIALNWDSEFSDHFCSAEKAPIVAIPTVDPTALIVTKEIAKARRDRGIAIAQGIEATRLKIGFTIRKIGIDCYALPGIMIRFIPTGIRGDKTLFSIAVKIPAISAKYTPIGVVRSGKNKSVFFSADRDLADRFPVMVLARLKLCLKIIGLIDSDSLKNVNCSLASHWIACPKLGRLLGINFVCSPDPSVPYRVGMDRRSIKATHDRADRFITINRQYRDNRQTLRAMY
jgi:hypothetical protein